LVLISYIWFLYCIYVKHNVKILNTNKQNKTKESMKIYDAYEVADVLGISRARVLKLIRDGELKALDLGVTRITQEQLDDYLKGK
jgi:excisionase family DNA binding protein